MTAVGVNQSPHLAPLPPGPPAAPIDERPVYSVRRLGADEDLPPRATAPGAELVGPAVVEEAMSTTLVHPANAWTPTTSGTC